MISPPSRYVYEATHSSGLYDGWYLPGFPTVLPIHFSNGREKSPWSHPRNKCPHHYFPSVDYEPQSQIYPSSKFHTFRLDESWSLSIRYFFTSQFYFAIWDSWISDILYDRLSGTGIFPLPGKLRGPIISMDWSLLNNDLESRDINSSFISKLKFLRILQ